MRVSYPKIEDYAFIGDCHGSALVSRSASIDWCCMPRMDSPSCFARLLDWKCGGHCSLAPVEPFTSRRSYLDGTLVLETTFATATGEARLLDCFAMRPGGRLDPHRQLIRVVEGIRGRVAFHLDVVPRFDYGEIEPWLRRLDARTVAAIGGSTGLVIGCDAELALAGEHDLAAEMVVDAGRRQRLSVVFYPPEALDGAELPEGDRQETDRRLDGTIAWWREWSDRIRPTTVDASGVHRSALVLKGLTNAPTGAVAAAATTSLPESLGGERNWDYRFSWVRDSTFTVRSLAEIGADREADGFRRFVQRSAAGSARDLQIMYGLGGERRLTEISLDHLEGYAGSRPVRIGNGAASQLQLDMYGELMTLSWDWYERSGHQPDDDYWRFMLSLVESACEHWRAPDRSLWEIRGEPRHFVHSKAMCWAAIDRGIALAGALGRPAPIERWKAAAHECRQAVETQGYDSERGVFTQAFGESEMDAALLLLPSFGFCDYRDPRMVRTTELIREQLGAGGLVRRYRTAAGVDGLQGDEGVFITCTFWLAECLARQGRTADARRAFERALATRNDLGLFSEEWDPGAGRMLGNFPQGLTHLSHIAAAVALGQAESGRDGAA